MSHKEDLFQSYECSAGTTKGSVHILSDLNSTLSESGPDDEITEDEFNETLRRSGKDTAPDPDKVQILGYHEPIRGGQA